MGLRIRSNISSLAAQRHFAETQREMQRHMERMASGRRINRAADDAAGLAISEILRADVRSLGQARRNASDGVSVIQVAEGALSEIQSIVVRLRELAVQSASDTVGDRERSYLNGEFRELKAEIDRIAVATEFNGTRLLVGPGQNLDPSLTLGHNAPPLEVQVDKDFVPQVDGLEHPHPLNLIRINLERINARVSGDTSLQLGLDDDPEAAAVDRKERAQASIDRLDRAGQQLASHRAYLGAMQNRLTSAERNLGVRMENLSAARSRIVDADYAAETAHYTQWTILSQAGSAVLAQANQMPQVALSLLKF